MDQKQFDLLQTTLQWVADERQVETRHSRIRHYQGNYGMGTVENEVLEPKGTYSYYMPVCATSACVAGNAVLAHGDRFVIPSSAPGYVGQQVTVTQCIDSDGYMHAISERAQQLLGLTHSEARRLFDGELSRNYVLRVGELIAYQHGYTLNVIR